MLERPRVALLIEMSGVHGRRILQGITHYLQTHRPWTIVIEQQEMESAFPDWFDTWHGDGIISRWSGPGVSEALRSLDKAVVDVSSRQPHFGLPRITTDDFAVGVLAAEHLLERSLQSFAFYGLKGELWSVRRRDGFAATVAKARRSFQVFDTAVRGPHRGPTEDEMIRLGQWLDSLPKPLGLMVCKDLHGPYVMEACQRFDLRIPDDVAVIGADDDSLLCELTKPPLSSVICNPEQIGYEAAALLERLMAGEKAVCEDQVVPPVGVTTRLSTDVLAIDDERVVAALRYIHAHACYGITVPDVLQHVGLSRATLDRQFRKYLQRSPQAEIRAAQLNRAKQLLAETDHSMHRIADLTGFSHAEYFHFAFKREFGTTPRTFRAQSRAIKARSLLAPTAR